LARSKHNNIDLMYKDKGYIPRDVSRIHVVHLSYKEETKSEVRTLGKI